MRSEVGPPAIVPVIDILGGVVVRGIAGRRETYRPIRSTLTESTDPVGVLRDLCRAFEPTVVYVADLDAIVHGKRDVELWRTLAECPKASEIREPQLWLDAGFARAADLPDIPGIVPVIGLESQTSFADMPRMLSNAPHAVFSLDLKCGRPIANGDYVGLSAVDIARIAVDAGVARMLLLDLAAVGMGNGTGTLELLGELSVLYPHVEYYGGGGVTSRHQLEDPIAYNYSGILIASALHDGRIPGVSRR